MLIIQFSFSTDTFSSSETSKYIVPFLKFISPNISAEALEFWHHVIRKASHVTEYLIQGMLVYRAFHLDVAKLAKVRIYSVFFIASTALVDEFHQSFVPSRGSSLIDVGYDCAGGLIALVLLWGWNTMSREEE